MIRKSLTEKVKCRLAAGGENTMRLPSPLAAYRWWREWLAVRLEGRRLDRAAKSGDRHAICDVLRRQLFWFTGDPAILEMTDDEIEDGMQKVAEVFRASGVTTEEAANALFAVVRGLAQPIPRSI